MDKLDPITKRKSYMRKLFMLLFTIIFISYNSFAQSDVAVYSIDINDYYQDVENRILYTSIIINALFIVLLILLILYPDNESYFPPVDANSQNLTTVDIRKVLENSEINLLASKLTNENYYQSSNIHSYQEIKKDLSILDSLYAGIKSISIHADHVINVLLGDTLIYDSFDEDVDFLYAGYKNDSKNSQRCTRQIY